MGETQTVFASVARTAEVESQWFNNQQFRGIVLLWDITAISGTPPVLTMRIQAIDEESDTVFTWRQFAVTQNAVTFNIYDHVSGQGAAIDGQDEAHDHDLPLGRWRIQVSPSTAESATYSMSYRPYR